MHPTLLLQILIWLAVQKRSRDFDQNRHLPKRSQTGEVELPGAEAEVELQLAGEKGAERGTELTSGVKGVDSEEAVEVPTGEVSRHADYIWVFSSPLLHIFF